MSEFVVSGEELKQLQQDASVSSAIKELANILSGRSQDLPHRFRAPSSLKQYFDKFPVNTSMYHQLQLGNNYSNPMMLQVTTRPTQNILELVFQGADGMRLFTLEIEYGGTDDIPE
jgi:hypothetical protein